MRLAVIPARGGSKRIPRKNIRPFLGRPIMAWSIQAAQDSGCFDRIVVSTDDPEIAEIAQQFGAEAPFFRPADLSGDVAPVGTVVTHAIEWYGAAGQVVSECCCLFATAPFLDGASIRRGWDVLQASQADFAVSVTSFPFPIQRACRIREDRLQMIDPAQYLVRSQDLEEAYHDAGQFYWGRAEAWLRQAPLLGEQTAPVILPRYRVQDIDTPEDWQSAELMVEALARRTAP